MEIPGNFEDFVVNHQCSACGTEFRCDGITYAGAGIDVGIAFANDFLQTMTEMKDMINCPCVHYTWKDDVLRRYCSQSCCKGCSGEEISWCEKSDELSTLLGIFDSVKRLRAKKMMNEVAKAMEKADNMDVNKSDK
jgi:hypothetical protein